MMKTKSRPRFFAALILFSLTGQIAWVVENMYLNVFIYKIFSASPSDISLMVGASAVTATVTTVLIGALSDRIGRRKLFIAGGYIAWGLSILAFSLAREDVLSSLFPGTLHAASLGISLVITLDCVMTFFGSSANDAAFNAWLTDATDDAHRGAAEGLNAMMPLLAILVVFGGFMFLDLDLPQSWTVIFFVIGLSVIVIGILGLVLIRDTPTPHTGEGYFRVVLYGFSPAAVRGNPAFYSCLLAFTVFNIAIQIFMPYLIIYYEVSLGMADYVLIMAPAIILAAVCTALWGRVFDARGFRFAVLLPLCALAAGCLALFIFRGKMLVFLGSLLMMAGYLAGTAAFGAKLRAETPHGRAGQLQGVRIFTQVLLPGVIGPFIGKSILRDAPVITGGDGTTSFVPTADIFLAAGITALVLFLLLFLSVKRPEKQYTDLRTPHTPDEIPFSALHPDPMMQREHYENLNGPWQFSVTRKGRTVYEGSITVPFPPEAPLSGVLRVTRRGDRLTYRRTFTAARPKGRLLLHFGAVDTYATVFLNGIEIGRHAGNYLPFSFDITSYLTEGENCLTVEVTDPLDYAEPYGKQSKKPHGMWYTPVSGIWQTVWLEEVPDKYIRALHITPTQNSVTVTVEGGEEEKTLLLSGEAHTFCGSTYTLSFDTPHNWSPEEPYLYRFTLLCGEDRVSSYFALREIGRVEKNGKTVMTLNGRPYFFHGLLDQGYYPDGLFLPPSEAGYEGDIRRMKELGFNMLRKHIKVEPKVFYYYCDLYGMAVFQDMVNCGRYSFFYDTALPTLGLRRLPKRQNARVRENFYRTAEGTVRHLYNHPSVLCFTVFNEGWGQHDTRMAYARLKPLSPDRLFDTASGWFYTAHSDLQSEHIYFKRAAFPMRNDRPVVLSEFGGYAYAVTGHLYDPEGAFGYKTCHTAEELTAALVRLYTEEVLPLVQGGLSAAVLTQLSDVESEINGLLTYDRAVCKPDPAAMQALAAALKQACEE